MLTTTVPARAQPVTFDWFEYTGRDAVFETPLPPGSYRNPILAGFYPDPSITQAGDKFYLVNSTFAYFPGIPVFESTDLVHWRQIGHVIDRQSQLSFDGLGVSRGVFAPAIAFHKGTFYVLNTAVDSGGNFFSKAQNPAGPWSDPVWLKEIDGIDPSIFFDTDGKAYIVNNGPPPGTPLYQGHRAIWIQEFDVASGKLIGPRRVLVNGGIDISQKPVWIEGPHLYHRNGWYVLSCAEGGTEIRHSQVVLRSRSVWGPYKPFEHNPILTQRDLPADRPHPVINAGHADLVEAADGSWWAVFLASRAYAGHQFNTGRETFLLPVSWKNDWPVILEPGRTIPYVESGPKLMANDGSPASAFTGNFTWRDEFDSLTLNPAWLQVRVPTQAWMDLQSTRGSLTIRPLAEPLNTLANPSFLARRQQHTTFEASTALTLPERGTVAAGMAAFQNENYWYFLGVRRKGPRMQIFLERRAGSTTETLATMEIAAAQQLNLKIAGDGRDYSFYYDTGGTGWKTVKEKDDGSILSTEVAGGFVGATVGVYARAE